MRFTRAPGLTDEHACARAEADDQGNEEEDNREHTGDGCERLSAEHLADVDAVDGARHGLEEIGEDHGGQEKEVGFPEGVLGGGDLHWVGLGAARDRNWRSLRHGEMGSYRKNSGFRPSTYLYADMAFCDYFDSGSQNRDYR